MHGGRHRHWTDNLFISQFRKLVISGKARDLNCITRLDIGLRQAECRPSFAHVEVRDDQFIIPLPFLVDRVPLLFRQLVDFGSKSVVLTGTSQMLGVIAARRVPGCTKDTKRVNVVGLGYVGFWLNSKVRMSQLVGPFITRVHQDEGWRTIPRDGSHGVCS